MSVFQYQYFIVVFCMVVVRKLLFCETGSIVYLGRTQHCCVLVTCVFRHLGQGQA